MQTMHNESCLKLNHYVERVCRAKQHAICVPRMEMDPSVGHITLTDSFQRLRTNDSSRHHATFNPYRPLYTISPLDM